MRIRKKFTIIMLVTAMLPLAISMGMALWHSSLQARDLTIELAQGRIDTAAQKLSGFFSERIAEVAVYSQTSLLKTMDFSMIRPFLISEMSRHQDVYEKFILGTPEGHFYNTSGGNPGVGGLRTFNDKDPGAKPKHIRKRDYWQQTVGNNTEALQRTYVSDPMISYTTGAKQIVVASTILSPESLVKGMIGGALPWTDIQNRIKQVNDEVIEQLGRDARFFLVSHTGTYWYHWNPEYVVNLKRDDEGNPLLNEIGEKVVIKNNIQNESIPEFVSAGARMMRGESGHTEYTDPESGETNYLVFSPVTSANYSIGIVVPRDKIMAPVQNLQLMFIYIFLVAAAFVSLVALIASRKVSTPVVSLNRMAREISQGNWAIKLEAEGKDEISELTESFNSMAGSLEKREQSLKQSEDRLEKINVELESRIKERTRELKESNESLLQQVNVRIAAELALRESEILLKNTGRLAHVGGWKLNVLNNELSWTEETYKIHEISGGESPDIETAINYFSEDSRPVFKKAVEDAISNEVPFDLELLINTAQGNKKWVRLLCRAHREEDKVFELIGAYQDITELKKVERLKAEFISTISHELRTPLTSIRGSLSILLSGKKVKIEEPAKKLLDIADRNSERLLLLINDLLDMDKIESGTLDFILKPVSLTQLLEQAIVENESYGQQLGIGYTLNDDIPDVNVNVDKERFLQVMSNLISNATKFSTSGFTVDVSARRIDGDRVQVSVRDYGQGVPENFREKIFTRFSQADASDTRQQGGTGLGLFISKSIIESMAGEISYESVPGEGAKFYFTLAVVAT